MPGLAPLMNVFILRALRLLYKLHGQGYFRERLKSSLRKFYGQQKTLTPPDTWPFPILDLHLF